MRGPVRLIVAAVVICTVLYLVFTYYSRKTFQSYVNKSYDPKKRVDKRLLRWIKTKDQINRLGPRESPDSDLQINSHRGGPRVQHEEGGRSEDGLNRNLQLPPATSDEDDVFRSFQKKLSGQQRLVHLDLKGGPPKLAYLKLIFPLFKKWGATGLLLEYEDMFPFKGALGFLSAKNSYTEKDIKDILALASDNNLQVMPLIQTFGHMEFILKNETFKEYREVSYTPQAILAIPCHPPTLKLIKMILKQVINLHPAVKYFHIGSDEVYHLGKSEKCKKLMKEKQWTKERLFLEHVKAVARHIKDEYKNIQPVMWDDMYRKVPVNTLKDSGMSKVVEPMIWGYQPDVVAMLPQGMWARYSQVFSHVWMASSFKGATGVAQYITDMDYHLHNHLSWIQVMQNITRNFPQMSIRGTALTGWQRFDHFSVLCELLPVALPSLHICLNVLKEGRFSDSSVLDGCQGVPLKLRLWSRPLAYPQDCQFPGSSVFKAMFEFHNAMLAYQGIFDPISGRLAGWMSDYHKKHGFSSNGQIDVVFKKYKVIKKNFTEVEKDMKDSMAKIYQPDVITEWIEVNIEHRRLKLDEAISRAQILYKSKAWERRPLSRLSKVKKRMSSLPKNNPQTINHDQTQIKLNHQQPIVDAKLPKHDTFQQQPSGNQRLRKRRRFIPLGNPQSGHKDNLQRTHNKNKVEADVQKDGVPIKATDPSQLKYVKKIKQNNIKYNQKDKTKHSVHEPQLSVPVPKTKDDIPPKYIQ